MQGRRLLMEATLHQRDEAESHRASGPRVEGRARGIRVPCPRLPQKASKIHPSFAQFFCLGQPPVQRFGSRSHDGQACVRAL